MKHLPVRLLQRILCLCMLISFVRVQAQQITGFVNNPGSNNFIYFVYSSGLVSVKDSVALTASQTFHKVLKIKHGTFVQLAYNKHKIDLYFFPGCKYKVAFDGSTDTLFHATFSVSGDYHINHYLDSIGLDQSHYKYVIKYVKLNQPIDSFSNVLAGFRKYSDSLRTAFFQAYHQNVRSSPLKEFLFADSINWLSYSILTAIDYFKSFQSGNLDSFWQQEVVNRISSLTSPPVSKSPFYSTMWFFYLRQSYASKYSLKARQNPTTSRGFSGFVYEYIQSHNLPPKLQEVLAAELLYSTISMYNYQSLDENAYNDSVITLARSVIHDSAFLTAFDRYYTSQKQLVFNSLPGKKAPNVSLQDTSGNIYTMADFSGKIVLVDVWATWCKPCLDELPYLIKLEERLKGQDFVILSVSADDSRQEWIRKGINKLTLPGTKLWQGEKKEFNKQYNVYALPVMVLLDRNGNFIEYNPSRASEGEKLYELIVQSLSK